MMFLVWCMRLGNAIVSGMLLCVCVFFAFLGFLAFGCLLVFAASPSCRFRDTCICTNQPVSHCPESVIPYVSPWAEKNSPQI